MGIKTKLLRCETQPNTSQEPFTVILCMLYTTDNWFMLPSCLLKYCAFLQMSSFVPENDYCNFWHVQYYFKFTIHWCCFIRSTLILTKNESSFEMLILFKMTIKKIIFNLKLPFNYTILSYDTNLVPKPRQIFQRYNIKKVIL